MADWRSAAMATFLADGVKDLGEKIKALKKELTDNGRLDLEAIRFLTDLRLLLVKKAKTKKVAPDPAFDAMFFKLLYEEVMSDRTIDRAEAGWLREVVYADGRVDSAEKAFLQKLKKAAKDKTSPEFERLYEECVGNK